MPAPPVNTGDVRHGGQRVNSLLARLTLRGGARGRRGLEAGGGRCPDGCNTLANHASVALHIQQLGSLPMPDTLPPAPSEPSARLAVHPAKRSKRTIRPAPHMGVATRADVLLWRETVSACWPWRWYEYPGWMRQAGADVGIAPNTAKRYMTDAGRKAVPREIAERIAAYLEARAARALTLAGQWRAYAATRPTETHVGRALERRHGWRGIPSE